MESDFSCQFLAKFSLNKKALGLNIFFKSPLCSKILFNYKIRDFGYFGSGQLLLEVSASPQCYLLAFKLYKANDYKLIDKLRVIGFPGNIWIINLVFFLVTMQELQLCFFN